MISQTLKDIFKDDSMDLLNIKEKARQITTDERFVNSFLEIVSFFEKNGRKPEANNSDINEFRLHSRLNSINSDPEKIKKLADFDNYHLLQEVKNPKSMEEIIEDDELSLLKTDEDLLNLKNIPDAREFPDYVGKQRPCKDFDRFENLFSECHQQHSVGMKNLRNFSSEDQIREGRFFLIKGLLVYVTKVGKEVQISKKQKNKGNRNARLRVIYENGNESDILLRSLARELYNDGKRVVDTAEESLAEFEEVGQEDTATGYIYILKSLSTNAEIANIEHLYKIGFSSKPVEERIKNAEKDPTYLMAPVEIIGSYRCYNLNPQKLEHLLHRFFAKSRLDAELVDDKKEKYIPGEWFSVPYPVIDQAITLLLNGEIVNYVYDPDSQEISLRKKK